MPPSGDGSCEADARLLGPVRFTVVTKEEAEGNEALNDFSCGNAATCDGDELKAVEEVHKIVDNLYKGSAVPQTLALMEKEDSGVLIALCGICEANLRVPGIQPPFPALPGDGAAINVI